jgi:hypothetical protein
MDQIFSYAAIVGFFSLAAEAFILLFKTEKIERILLNDKKKLLLDFVRILIIGFGISLVLYSMFIEPNMEGAYAYLATLIVSCILGAEIYYIAISTIQDIGFGKSFYIEDEVFGKLYLIKSSSNKFILFADKPRVRQSSFTIFKDGSFIEGRKIFSEHKSLIDKLTFHKKKEVSSTSQLTNASSRNS